MTVRRPFLSLPFRPQLRPLAEVFSRSGRHSGGVATASGRCLLPLRLPLRQLLHPWRASSGVSPAFLQLCECACVWRFAVGGGGVLLELWILRALTLLLFLSRTGAVAFSHAPITLNPYSRTIRLAIRYCTRMCWNYGMDIFSSSDYQLFHLKGYFWLPPLESAQFSVDICRLFWGSITVIVITAQNYRCGQDTVTY